MLFCDLLIALWMWISHRTPMSLVGSLIFLLADLERDGAPK